MSELIKVKNNNGNQTISARELYDYLEINERFSRWFERMCAYGLVESIDYTPYQNVHPLNHQEISDFALTLDCAKEISMIQRSEKGKTARKYFINCEKALKNTSQLPDFSNPAIAARAWADQVEAKMIAEARVNQLAPKAELADTIIAGKEIIDVGMAAKILQLPYGRNTMFKNLRNSGVFFKNRNEPKQQYITQGYFKLKEVIINRDNHDPLIKLKVLVTQKGLAWLHKLLSVNNETPKHITFD